MTNKEAVEILKQMRAEIANDRKWLALDHAIEVLEGSDSRACYPVHMTTPGPITRHISGYFDPTRRLLFTAYMTEELAKDLGIKWWRE